MKTLFLIRHAKSSWANPDQSDFDRPLNERGRRDAPVMAQRLLEKNYNIDQILYSSSVRTTETMQVFRSILGLDNKKCIPFRELYHASAYQLKETISQINENCNGVVLIGHNPGITEFANTLTNVRTDNMPTCAIFAVQSIIVSWTEFENAKKEFLFFDYPKLN